MNIIKQLCQKYRAMIEAGEVIDLNEVTTELEGMALKDLCPDLAEHLEKNND